MSGIGTGVAIAAGVGALGTVAGGMMSSSAAQSAANAQVQASENANALQKYMYDQNRTDSAPWRTAGAGAVDYVSRLLGIPGSTESQIAALQAPVMPQLKAGAKATAAYNKAMQNYNTQEANYNAQVKDINTPINLTDTLRSTPGYQFTMDQGTQAIQRNAAASGRLDSGATLKALQTFGEGTADQTYNNYINQLMSVAGLGQTSTTALGNTGSTAANNMSANTMAAGNAQASGYINSANAVNGAISGVGNTVNGGLQNYMLMNYLSNN